MMASRETGIVLQVARAIALIGAGWGSLILIWVGLQQVVVPWRGGMPLKLALELSTDSWPFLLVLLLPCLGSIALALRRNDDSLPAIVWAGTAAILTYGLYRARFSVGPFLIPSATLIGLAGLLILGRHVYKRHKA